MTAQIPALKTTQYNMSFSSTSPHKKGSNSHGVLKTIVIELKRPSNPALGFCTPSNKCSNIPGTRRLPNPKDNAAAITKRSRRVNLLYDKTRIPETATLANRKVVTPPNTELGTKNGHKRMSPTHWGVHLLDKNTPLTFPITPKKIKNTQHHRPASRFAQRVTLITPLFCAKMESGVTVNRADKKPPIPSAWLQLYQLRLKYGF